LVKSAFQNATIANIANQNIVTQGIKPNDSTAIAAVEENALEKYLREKQLKDKEEKIVAVKSSKWKVRPNVAPIIISASGCSPIDS